MLLLLLSLACAPPPDAPDAPGLGSLAQPGFRPVLTTAPGAARVLLNELMAANDSIVQDERGETDDWVELYNASDEAVALDGWGLSDDLSGPSWTLPEGSRLGAGERLLIWLDSQPEQGANHASFSLDAEGEALALWGPASEGTPLVDALTFERQQADTALGRFPDGSAYIASTVWPTPWSPNPFDPGLEDDPSENLFTPDRVQSWELLVSEESLQSLSRSPYTEVAAAISYRGAWLSPVGLRLKGVYGSLRDVDEKFAFVVDLNAYTPGTRLRGKKKLTFNNMVQDSSYFHERTAYALFEALRVPAPRNSYAAVYLNDEYIGLYLNIESPDDDFLARWYSNPNGNLYEGAYGADVTLSGYGSLEWDEHGEDDVSDQSDLIALATLLAETPSEDLVPELEALVDVDACLRMVAGEVMIGHWDGYFYYPNNYRLYHDPDTGQFSLLPWGLDQTFGWEGGLTAAKGRLAWWMLKIPSIKERYFLALWEAADRLREADVDGDASVVAALITDWVDADPRKESSVSTMLSGIAATQSFVDEWPEEVVDTLFPDGEPALDTGAP